VDVAVAHDARAVEPAPGCIAVDRGLQPCAGGIVDAVVVALPS
jgi:hypothetical protein